MDVCKCRQRGQACTQVWHLHHCIIVQDLGWLCHVWSSLAHVSHRWQHVLCNVHVLQSQSTALDVPPCISATIVNITPHLATQRFACINANAISVTLRLSVQHPTCSNTTAMNITLRLAAQHVQSFLHNSKSFRNPKVKAYYCWTHY